MFGSAFHKLAHSGPSLDAILHIEYGYALAVQDIMSRKSRQVISVTKKYVCILDIDTVFVEYCIFVYMIL